MYAIRSYYDGGPAQLVLEHRPQVAAMDARAGVFSAGVVLTEMIAV